MIGDTEYDVAMAQAIGNSQVGRVDVVGFDACLMASIEIASEVAPVASTLVAAERTEPGDGWDYTAMLSALQGTTTGAEFAVLPPQNARLPPATRCEFSTDSP